MARRFWDGPVVQATEEEIKAINEGKVGLFTIGKINRNDKTIHNFKIPPAKLRHNYYNTDCGIKVKDIVEDYPGNQRLNCQVCMWGKDWKKTRFKRHMGFPKMFFKQLIVYCKSILRK